MKNKTKKTRNIKKEKRTSGGSCSSQSSFPLPPIEGAVSDGAGRREKVGPGSKLLVLVFVVLEKVWTRVRAREGVKRSKRQRERASEQGASRRSPTMDAPWGAALFLPRQFVDI